MSQERLKFAAKLGADAVVNVSGKSEAEVVAELLGGNGGEPVRRPMVAVVVVGAADAYGHCTVCIKYRLLRIRIGNTDSDRLHTKWRCRCLSRDGLQ